MLMKMEEECMYMYTCGNLFMKRAPTPQHEHMHTHRPTYGCLGSRLYVDKYDLPPHPKSPVVGGAHQLGEHS